ncbi:unnamed protein product [Cuscuta europaea]|uniref:Uncharacterized protein n=1 Tax=Cuscuta europaea TaxID=41803 RepID=A0A9P1E1A7_CUSEU|nr:unnamed protein product [Cuscuta europaea]
MLSKGSLGPFKAMMILSGLPNNQSKILNIYGF